MASPKGWQGRGGSRARPGRGAGQFPAWGLERLSLFQQYLGSMLIKDLRGTESTQDACAKMRVRRPRGRGICSQPVVGGGERGSPSPSLPLRCHQEQVFPAQA